MRKTQQSKKKQHANFKKDNNQAVQFKLTADQLTIIQNILPKGYKLVPANQYTKISDYLLTKDKEISVKLNSNPRTTRLRQRQDSKQKQGSTNLKKQTLQSSSSLNINFCKSIIDSLKDSPHSQPFLEPVDSSIEGAQNYFQIIKTPMDLSTVQLKLSLKNYKKFTEFNDDLRQIWENSYIFNKKNSKIYRWAYNMQKLHEKLIQQREQSSQQGIFECHKQKKMKRKRVEQIQTQISNT